MSDQQHEQVRAGVPDWDDELLDRAADRLAAHYDLEDGLVVEGERFDLYGELLIENQKQFVHRSINFANHQQRERVFARRVDSVTVADMERLVELGHTLADQIDADEEHQATEFTFVVVADDLPAEVRSFVEGFEERTLIKFGYYGHYEIHLAVIGADTETFATSKNGQTGRAFAVWAPLAEPKPDSLFRRLLAKLLA